MSNAPTCRNCQHAAWVLSKSGKQIKQKTAGECGHAKALKAWAEKPTECPAVVGVRVDTRCIWPDMKAHKCPGFVRKTRDDTACA